LAVQKQSPSLSRNSSKITATTALAWHCPLPEGNEFVPRLVELKNLIIDINESKPEYKKLPPTKGARI